MSEATFIGIDLAWRGGKNLSGAAVLRGDRRCAELVEIESLVSSDVPGFVEKQATNSTIIAVDAPLIIRNPEGQRRCETLLSKYYGARGASCHSSNLAMPMVEEVLRLTSYLESQKFIHAPRAVQPKNYRVMLEVYPHTAILELFRLESIIKYKKGKVQTRRSGQQELQDWLKKLIDFRPALKPTPKLSEYLTADVNLLRGRSLKAHEDGLDAILCAYVAYHYWFWGQTGARLFGDLDFGYIVVPILPSSSFPQ